VHGRGRRGQGRHVLDGMTACPGAPLQDRARVRRVGPACPWRSGATSGSACATARRPWACLPARPDHAGSSLVDVGGSKIIDCPYTGEKLLARARPLPPTSAPPRAPRGPLRQLPDRRLCPHGRRHLRAGPPPCSSRGRDRERGGDPPDSRPARSSRASSWTPSFTCPTAPTRTSATGCTTPSRITSARMSRAQCAPARPPCRNTDRYVHGPPPTEYLALFGKSALAERSGAGKELVS